MLYLRSDSFCSIAGGTNGNNESLLLLRDTPVAFIIRAIFAPSLDNASLSVVVDPLERALLYSFSRLYPSFPVRKLRYADKNPQKNSCGHVCFMRLQVAYQINAIAAHP